MLSVLTYFNVKVLLRLGIHLVLVLVVGKNLDSLLVKFYIGITNAISILLLLFRYYHCLTNVSKQRETLKSKTIKYNYKMSTYFVIISIFVTVVLWIHAIKHAAVNNIKIWVWYDITMLFIWSYFYSKKKTDGV